MLGVNAMLAPGMRVRHPGRPDWGDGQVQSVAGGRITVNFPEAGKVVIDGTRIPLVLVALDET
jgi:FKBP-type peptidyl-prolyl cis-trans isomerase 2